MSYKRRPGQWRSHHPWHKKARYLREHTSNYITEDSIFVLQDGLRFFEKQARICAELLPFGSECMTWPISCWQVSFILISLNNSAHTSGREHQLWVHNIAWNVTLKVHIKLYWPIMTSLHHHYFGWTTSEGKRNQGQYTFLFLSETIALRRSSLSCSELLCLLYIHRNVTQWT